MNVASIIIATYNHAAKLGAAIGSALAQTVPCEVIVVDDGSTDDTMEMTKAYGYAIRYVVQTHQGPAVARNFGLDLARADFVMFLDADDFIDTTKVEQQIAAFEDGVGWVLCDVSIEDSQRGVIETASARYRYDDRALNGWIQDALTIANFIPVMSPLVRRDVLNAHRIRFDPELTPEDWHFWHALAGVAQARYLPKVLATYRKTKGGRSWTARPVSKLRGVVPPLRLNLGCGRQNAPSWHPLPGMVNLDKSFGWTFEDGLGEFVAGSVAGITISHALMFVERERWPYVFGEFARVLAPGGVVRITEDDSKNPASARYGGWKGSEPAVVLMNADDVLDALRGAGMEAYVVGSHTSRFADLSLCQQWHGNPPDVFFVEGVRRSALFLSPHNDDETLFGSFTIMRYRPRVVVCYPSSGDYGDPELREAETREAVAILGGGPVEQWDGGDILNKMRELDVRTRPTVVFAPSPNCSHPDHKIVAYCAAKVFGERVRDYETYVLQNDEPEKVRVPGQRIAYEPGWLLTKLHALACYRSQIHHPRAKQFFEWDLAEYGEP